MPRLKNKVTGVVISVGDDLVAKLSRDWEPAEESKSVARRTRKKAADDE